MFMELNERVQEELDILVTNYPQLSMCVDDVLASYELIKDACQAGGIIMVCGNGGSAADAEHIVSELMKGFKQKRPITNEQRDALLTAFPGDGAFLANNLQRGIPTISLVSQSSLISAFTNDVTHDMVFAQQVFGYGVEGDVLIGISTSGHSRNVVNACKVAKAFGIRTIGMTGENGGELPGICDVTIRVPASDTFRVQEYHLPVYHVLCAMLESVLFE